MSTKSRKSKQSERRARKQRDTAIRYAIIATVIVGAGAAWVLTRPPESPPVASERIAFEHSKGADEAPITIIEYGDFNCPSCLAYHQAGIIEQLFRAYPDQIRFVWHHFPVITPASPRLAQAAECAADQDAFWEFHDLAFQDAPNRPADMARLAEAV